MICVSDCVLILSINLIVLDQIYLNLCIHYRKVGFNQPTLQSALTIAKNPETLFWTTRDHTTQPVILLSALNIKSMTACVKAHFSNKFSAFTVTWN